MTRVLALVTLVAATGCASSGLVTARAAEDMGCPEKEIKVTTRDLGTFDARGCGRKLSYVVRGGEVLSDDGAGE